MATFWLLWLVAISLFSGHVLKKFAHFGKFFPLVAEKKRKKRRRKRGERREKGRKGRERKVKIANKLANFWVRNGARSQTEKGRRGAQVDTKRGRKEDETEELAALRSYGFVYSAGAIHVSIIQKLYTFPKILKVRTLVNSRDKSKYRLVLSENYTTLV